MANKTPQDFVTFLKKEKLYRQFKDNHISQTESDGVKSDMNLFIKELKKDEISKAVRLGFEWANTDFQSEGFQFWSQVDMDWGRECKNA